ncbi:hypothetical protein [Streptomyces sp. NBC_00576]|nr:hypothetical protein [Streptomyces sp. NBC_00576]WUB68832.1 hypothetical protein OG734_01290 [Streptomyces sp. NBC_00576]
MGDGGLGRQDQGRHGEDTIQLRNLFGAGSYPDVFTRTTASTSM